MKHILDANDRRLGLAVRWNLRLGQRDEHLLIEHVDVRVVDWHHDAALSELTCRFSGAEWAGSCQQPEKND